MGIAVEAAGPGKPFPLGATPCADGVNFSVFSRHATGVFLCLFSHEHDDEPSRTIEFDPRTNRTGDLWHMFVRGLKPGAFYLY
ncbi:MAG: glycogen debranching enzyme, partial [Spirochaetaceae bacterium]|nr:glycogen debranching enzyme [Spirochaetaceae bacterium]